MEQLAAGTVLDGRYQIKSTLGAGGFGISYLAVNLHLEMQVVVKELFWRDHCARDEDGQTVVLLSPAEAEDFTLRRAHFLREARMIRDFSGQEGIVRIMDYFEANGTAYIVMEYIPGETLETVCRRQGIWDPETLLRRFLPLLDTLGRLHAGGVIHRDISPDNIMVQPDGQLKLIDFGAARDYTKTSENYTTVSKNCYSPPEQLDQKGTVGPASDVYAVCATLYRCIAGAAPSGSIQRMFLDELAAPSSLGIQILPAYEAILLQGLHMNAGRRYENAAALAEAIRAALPTETTEKRRRGPAALLGAILAVVLLAGGIFAWQYTHTAKYRLSHTETAVFALFPSEDMTTSEYAALDEALEQELQRTVGEDNYLLDFSGTELRVTVPLSAFPAESTVKEIMEQYTNSEPVLAALGDREISTDYAVRVDWEETGTMLSGENQVAPEELDGGILLLYAFLYPEQLTRAERVSAMLTVKDRLDALDVPYAFGLEENDDDRIAILLPETRFSPFVIYSLCNEYLNLSGDANSFTTTISNTDVSAEHTEDGLLLTGMWWETFLSELEEQNCETVYLEARELYGYSYTIAQVSLSDFVAEDDWTYQVLFRDFCLEGETEGETWILDYLVFWMNETELTVAMEPVSINRIDQNGNVFLGEQAQETLIFKSQKKPTQVAMQQLKDLAEGESCLFVQEWGSELEIYAYLDSDAYFVEKLTSLYNKMENAGLGTSGVPAILRVCDIEDGELLLTIYFNDPMAEDCGSKYGYSARCDLESERIVPYTEELRAFWDSIG